jgi:hypothetical protein
MQGVIVNNTHRVISLDGLRGIAIFFVVVFHTFAHWGNVIPWATFSEFPFFKYGSFGVELFFLISGFVIYMTLEKTQNLYEFLFRRWLRLFPAMLFASIFIYATSFYFIERPFGQVNVVDIFPGLLFIDPNIINKFQNFTKFVPIEGSFWSLYVEVKFYVIFGFLYFINKKSALFNLIAIFLITFLYNICQQISLFSFIPSVNFFIYDLLSLQYFGSFCVGACLYRALNESNQKFITLSFILMFPTTLIIFNKYDDFFVSALVYLFFLLTLLNRKVAHFVSNQYLTFLGFISYPLYLLHENSLIALTIKTHNFLFFIPDFLTPLPGIFLILLVSFLIAKYFEPYCKNCLISLFKKS